MDVSEQAQEVMVSSSPQGNQDSAGVNDLPKVIFLASQQTFVLSSFQQRNAPENLHTLGTLSCCFKAGVANGSQ